MEILLEILLHIILEPIIEIVVGVPAEQFEGFFHDPRVSKSRKALLFVVFVVVLMVLLGLIAGIVCGACLIAGGETDKEKNIGTMLVAICGVAFVVYIAVSVVCANTKHRRKRRRKPRADGRPDRAALRKIVHVVIDRPLGSVHPKHPDIVYELNYGFVPEVMGGDGEAQDAYVIGAAEPITEFDGVVVAIIHRLDDVEDKWVVAPIGREVPDETIIEKTAFQEKFFQIEIVR